MRQIKNNYRTTKGVTLMLMLLLLSAGIFAGKPKPDLQITKIDKTRDCCLAITVRNNGPGKLPDEVYTIHHPKSAGVHITLIGSEGMALKEQIIWRVDTARKLQKKGGTFTFVFYPKVTSSVHVDAVVDRYDVVEEAKENNNRRERKFPICSPGPSTVRNIGTYPIGQKNSIPNIYFIPKSPSKLSPMQEVKIFFDYFTNEQQGVFIVANPMFQGSSLGCITAPSLLKPGGKGNGETYFTFGKAPVTVDAVRFQMLNATSKKIYEKIVKVKFDFRTIFAKPPQRVFLDFSGARLEYVPSSKNIRIRAKKIVISKGQDWESIKLSPHIYHLRQKYWGNFFWMVNTKYKQATLVKSGIFGQFVSGQTNVLIQGISVQVVGGGNDSPPQRFVLHFSKAYLEYTPTPGAVQVITENSVLSRSSDWRDCNMSANTFHIKKKEWKGYFWKISTAEKKAYKITGGSFCTSGGSAFPLPVGVRVFR